MARQQNLGLFRTMVLGALVLGTVMFPVAQAANLRDLIKRAPELYMPSQLIPGHKATFTVRGQAGQQVRVVVSATQSGATLPNGVALQVGKSVAEASGVIPASGVAALELTLPDSDDLLPGDMAYADAVLWTAENQADAQRAKVMQSTGLASGDNSLMVSEEADGGAMLVVPGDSSMTQVMRAVSTMSAASDPRKRQLIDDGTINQSRPLDRMLNIQPSNPTGF